MSRDGNGNFNLPVAPFIPNTDIIAQDVNLNFSDIAQALTSSIAKDGQTLPSSNLPMNTFRHTNVGNAQQRNEYSASGQVQNSAFVWGGTAGGTADALTISLSPSLPAYVSGLKITFISGASPNTGPATISVNGLPAQSLRQGGSLLTAGQILAGKVYDIVYTGSFFEISSSYLSSIDIRSVHQLAKSGVNSDITSLTGLSSITGTPTIAAGTLNATTGNITNLNVSGTSIMNGTLDLNGRLETQRGADVVAAASIDLTNSTGNFINVTGNTNISTIIIPDGQFRFLRFTGTPTLIQGANLPLFGRNLLIEAEDICLFVGYPSGVVRLFNHESNAIRIKAWAVVNQQGVQQLVEAYNVSSIIDGGTGVTTHVFTNAFNTANYNVLSSAGQSGSLLATSVIFASLTNTSYSVFVGLTSTFAANDAQRLWTLALGRN